jgi:hypothetical protein
MEQMAVMPMVVSVAFFALVAVIVTNGVRSKQRVARMQIDLQSKLIERFGSAPEFVGFLQSDSGRQFMRGMGAVPKAGARNSILASVRRAIVLSFLGLGFLAICLSPEYRNEGFFIAGCILLGLGVGYGISAVVSVKLSRAWGLMPSPGTDGSGTENGLSMHL